MIYYINENGNGAYCESLATDPMYDVQTCLLVPKRPANGRYLWDNASKVWILTMDSQKEYIRDLRNPELDRTDKYLLEDYPLTAEERAGAILYRQKLRDAPDKPTPQEMVMPTCPPYLDPQP